MSYCRFENTYRDLQDCADHLGDSLSDRESRFRERMVELCQNIIDEWDDIKDSLEEEEEEEE